MRTSLLKPLLPLRDIVIFPSLIVPLFVGREKSIKALKEAMKSDKSIVLITQKNSEIDDPTGKDLYQYGCMSKVLQLLKLPDGTVKVLVEGEKRVKIIQHHRAKQEGDKYTGKQSLIKVNSSILPSYIQENFEKYKDWLE